MLTFLLRNGLLNHDEKKDVEKLHSLSNEILQFFIEDENSLEFTPLEIAMSSILLASEIVGGKVCKKVKLTFQKVYDVKLENLIPSYGVIKR